MNIKDVKVKENDSTNVSESVLSTLDSHSLNEIKEELKTVSNENNYERILNNLELILKGQEVTQKDMQLGFIGLAKQNNELLKLNKELTRQLEVVTSEWNLLKEEREKKSALKEKRSNRKRLPKRSPMTSTIYNLLMKEDENPGYVATRTRIAICLLTVSGVRISELLPLKVGQLVTLLKEGWIEISRLKKGPANHKAFLTSEGKKLVNARKRDFEFLFAMKCKDSYVFTSDRKPYKMLRRETLTMDVNRVTRSVANCLESKPNITSHSFRIGYITNLWKDTLDIEFVRQAIGHSKIDTTSRYIEDLSEDERKSRMDSIC